MSFFFFNDTATTEIYTLSLHDALPIFLWRLSRRQRERAKDVLDPDAGRNEQPRRRCHRRVHQRMDGGQHVDRSEEHTSELQSLAYLVCRLLLEKKNKIQKNNTYILTSY